MFQVVTIKDNVRVEPDQLGRPTPDAIKTALTKSFADWLLHRADKVVPDVGLVIAVYDIKRIEGGYIYPSDGAVHFSVTFRLVVFRPFKGEVVVGKLISSTSTGLQISLGFFSDIHVPVHGFNAPSKFHKGDRLWCWNWQQDEEEDSKEFWYDLEEEIRFRVEAIKFHPVPTKQEMKAAQDAGEDALGTAANPYAPMQIVAYVNELGLGLTNWWDGSGGEAAEGDEAADAADPV